MAAEIRTSSRRSETAHSRAQAQDALGTARRDVGATRRFDKLEAAAKRYNPWYAALVGHCGDIRDVVCGSLAGPDTRRVPGRSLHGWSFDGTRRIFLRRRNRFSRWSKFGLGSAPRLGSAVWSGIRNRLTPTRIPLSWLLQRFSPPRLRLKTFPSSRVLWLGVPGLRVLRLSFLLRQRFLLDPGLLSRIRLLRIVVLRARVLRSERHSAAATGHRSPGG